MYIFLAICGLLLLSNIAHFGNNAGNLPRSSQVLPPSVVRPESMNDFQRREAATAEQLKRQAQAAQDALNKAKNGYLPCNPGLAGTRGISADGTPIVCGVDGIWHPEIAAPDRNPNHNAGMSEAEQRRLQREQRRQRALSSSTVAIDFSGERQAKDAVTPPEREEEPAVAVPTPAKPPKYDWDKYTGRLYKIFEGTILETVLTNRINGDATGPINTMVTTDLWSHDHQKLLIPQGTRCLGNVSAVNSGFQQRLFVAFHRCIMPDGYSLDLDRFQGLNQIGEVGLRDKVNYHYAQIFGTSIALGAIAGLSQIGNYGGYGYDPAVSIRAGIAQQTSQEAIHVLDHFLKPASNLHGPRADPREDLPFGGSRSAGIRNP